MCFQKSGTLDVKRQANSELDWLTRMVVVYARSVMFEFSECQGISMLLAHEPAGGHGGSAQCIYALLPKTRQSHLFPIILTR